MSSRQGRGGAPKSFQRADTDWDCPGPTCKNVNFGRRDKCFKCRVQKNVGDIHNPEGLQPQGSRQGYGGGFNERQKPLYTKHEDDE
eukprot:gene16423-30484_t